MSERCVPTAGGVHLFCKTCAGHEIEVKEKDKTYLQTYICDAQRSLVHKTANHSFFGSKKRQGSKRELYLSALNKAFLVYVCVFMYIYMSASVKFALLSVRISELVNIYFWQCTLDAHAGGDL